MPVIVPTTDEVGSLLTAALRRECPNAQLVSCGSFIDLWNAIPNRGYLADWMEVAARPDWRLERNTVANDEVHLRSEWHFRFDRHAAGEQERVNAVLGEWMAQVRPVGRLERLLVLRESDDDRNGETTVRALLLGQTRCNLSDHVRLDDRGVAWLIGTQTKVREIVLDHTFHKMNIETIYNEHYQTNPLEKIHAAFTWYDTHRSEVLAEIEASERFADEMRRKMGQPPAIAKLLASRK